MPAYIISFIIFASVAGFAHASYQGSGKTTMSGEIVEAACSIATDDVWQEINFGSIPLSDFAEGKPPLSKAIHIRLNNCVLDNNQGGTWNSVSVTFEGNVVENHKDIFAVTGEGRGVGVKITDENGYSAVPGQALPVVKLYEDNNDLLFNIHLERSSENLAAGDLYSFIRFMVAYQ